MATPHQPAQDPSAPQRPARLPTATTIAVAVLLIIPCLALALVPTYSRQTPKLGGWPFFYWYQVMWVLLTPIMTYSAYLLIKRARGDK
jgi:Protein of unknown function (DUF3311)